MNITKRRMLNPLFLFFILFIPHMAVAFNSGIDGRSGKQGSDCSACHSGGDFSSSVAISGSTSVSPGTTNDFTITLSHTASFAGFNLAVSDGTLQANDSGTRISNSELTHSTKRSGSANQTQWGFQWIAPSTAGSNTFWVCGNPVNGNGTTTGDESSTPCTTVAVTVVDNQAPVANDDSASVDEDSTVDINVTTNDTDSDGSISISTVVLITGVSNGTLSLSGSDGVVSYTPTADFNGTDSFSYTIKDDQLKLSNTATVTITVNSINDAPTAVNDSATVNEDNSVTISVLSNDSDIDGSLSSSSIVIASAPSNGSTSINTSSGTVTYTPNSDFNGADSFTYTVNDNDGATSNTATASIAITAVNDAPVASNDSATTTEDNAVSISILSNDNDGDGGTDLNTSSVIISGPGDGSVSLSNGIVTYTPTGNFNGSDSFTYTVKDGGGELSNSATVSITVSSVNDAPVANNDSVTTDESVEVSINILANDTDVDGTVDNAGITITSNVSNGTAAIDSFSGAVLYTPTANFNGSDSFSYTVLDNEGLVSNTATVSITITPVNTPPVAVDDSAITNEDNFVTINVLFNDSDSDGSLDEDSVAIATNPSNGSTSISGGSVTYTPTTNFNGADSFTYTVNDKDGGISNQGTVTITVNVVNDAPVAGDDTVSTTENVALSISILSNDSDVDGSLNAASVTIISGVSNGTTAINTSTGAVTYTPTTNFNGSDSFTYTVTDNENLVSNTATVSIAVTEVNDPPVANNDSSSTDEDNPVTIDILANDSDDGSLNSATIAVVTSPANGSVQLSGGMAIYTPTANFNGSDSFTYTVMDDGGITSNAATVTVAVNSINDAPTAADDAITTLENTAVTISVLSNDSDVDGHLNTASVTLLTAAANGTTTISTGEVTYTPNSQFNGSDSFTYTVTDNEGLLSNTATVTITITSVNELPVAANDSGTTDEDNPLTINVVANDSDTDGSIVESSVVIVSSPSNGTAAVLGGSVTYNPTANFNGSDSFTYTVNDNEAGTSNAATVSIIVNSINDLPVAANDRVTVNANEPATINILDNDSDVDGTLDTASVTIVTATSNGTTTINAGVVTYTANTDFEGADSFTYQVSDNEGGVSDIASVSITVRINQDPVANDDTITMDEDNSQAISVLSNDTDDLGVNAASVTVVQAPSKGTATVSIDGTINYTPADNVNGSDSLTYTVDDNEGLTSNVATLTITINPVNDAPVFASTPTTLITQSQNYQYNVTVTDVEDDAITLILTAGPAWLTLTGTSLSGISEVEDIGNHQVTLSANDGTDTTLQTFTLTVNARTDADIGISASLSPTAALVGESITLTYTIFNAGPAEATGISLIAFLAGSVDLSSTDVRCAVSNLEFGCVIDILGVNESVEVSMTVEATQATDIIAQAQINVALDPNTNNNLVTSVTSAATSYFNTNNNTQGDNTRHVVSGDINGDGFADAIYINGNGEDDQVYINSGTGQMSPTMSLADGLDGAAGALFDLDNDNDLDLVIANCTGHPNQVYFNNGGVLTLAQDLGQADSRGVAIGDFDGDGLVDIAFANADADNTIYTNNGDNSYSLAMSLTDPQGTTHSLGVVSADLDGNGSFDLVFANSQSANNVFFNNSSVGLRAGVNAGESTNAQQALSFEPAKRLGSANSLAVALVDANNDGQMDVLFANSVISISSVTPANNLYINQGQQQLSQSLALGSVNTSGVSVGDFDGDGIDDLFFINGHGAHQVYLGDNNAQYSLRSEAILNDHAKSATLSDLDNDGDLDLIFADTQAKTDNALINAGDGSVSSPTVDLSLTAEASAAMVAPQDNLTVTLSVTNPSAFNAQNSLLTVTLPATFTVNSGLDNCQASGSQQLCDLGDIGSGQTSAIVIAGTVTLSSGELAFSGVVSTDISDTLASNNSASTTVTVNQAPVANDDSATVLQDSQVTIDIIANDTDDRTLALDSVVIVNSPANGTAANSNGVVTYVPNAGFFGTDSFTYTVADNFGVVSNIATVAIAITEVAATPPPPPPSDNGGGGGGGGGGGSTDQLVLLGALLIWLGRRRLV